MGQLRQLLTVLPDTQTLNISFDTWWDIETGVMFPETHHPCLSHVVTQGILFQPAHFQKYLISRLLPFDTSSICFTCWPYKVISLSLITKKSGLLLLNLTMDFNLIYANISALSFLTLKIYLLLLLILLLLLPWVYHAVCVVLVPWTRIEPRPLAVKAWSPNH